MIDDVKMYLVAALKHQSRSEEMADAIIVNVVDMFGSPE